MFDPFFESLRKMGRRPVNFDTDFLKKTPIYSKMDILQCVQTETQTVHNWRHLKKISISNLQDTLSSRITHPGAQLLFVLNFSQLYF